MMMAEESRVKSQAEVQKLLQQYANDPAQLTAMSQKYAAGGNKEAAELFQDAATRATAKNDTNLQRGAQVSLMAITQAAARGVPLADIQEASNTVIAQGGTQGEILKAYEAGITIAEGKGQKFGTTVSEWVDPEDPNKVVLKTVQPEGSAFPIILGSNARVTSADLEGLVKRQGKPSVSVNVGDKAEGAYDKTLAEGLAEADLEIINNGTAAQNNLGTISEARLVLSEPGNDITGFGAETVTEAKSAMLSLMGALGVSENDSLYQKLSQETAAANLYNMFTQEFVKVRMAATKGAITEREFATFIASVPNLLQTTEGYKQVLDTMERANTAAVLKASYIESNIGTRKTAKEARDKWSSFSNKFPLGSLSSEAMTTVFSESTNPNFKAENLVFSYMDPESKERVKTTYGEISRAARRNGIAPIVALKRLFDKRKAQHVQL